MRFKIFITLLLCIMLSSFFTGKLYSEPRKVFLEFCTGTWCPWCPCGDWAAEQILVTYPQTIVVGYHGPYNYGGDPFTNFNGYSIIPLLGFSAYPTGIIDRTNSPSNPYVDYTMWFARVQARYNSQPNTVINVSMITKSYNTSTREMAATINSTALQTLTGQYKISYIVYEDNIVYNQSSNNVCLPGGPNYIHKWIVRNMVNSPAGENLNSGQWNQNQMISKTVTTTLDAGWVASNCNFVVVVYKDSSAGLNMSNVQQSLLQSVTNPLGITGSNEIPGDYSLSQNYPNPFNPTTNVKFTIPKSGNVSLKIYDMVGNEVATYIDGFVKAGSYNAEIDGSNWSSGVYFYRLNADGFTETKKMMLVK